MDLLSHGIVRRDPGSTPYIEGSRLPKKVTLSLVAPDGSPAACFRLEKHCSFSCKFSGRNRSNWERQNAMNKAPTLAIALLVAAFPAAAQQCPRGPIDIPALTEQIYEAKDPNVVFRAAAIGGQALIPGVASDCQARKIGRDGGGRSASESGKARRPTRDGRTR